MQQRIQDSKKQNTLLRIFLNVTIVFYGFFPLLYVLELFSQIGQDYVYPFGGEKLLTSTFSILTVIFAIFLLKWKMWAYWMLWILALGGFGLAVYVKGELVVPIRIISLVILYFLMRPQWDLFE